MENESIEVGSRVVIIESQYPQEELQVGKKASVVNVYGPESYGLKADSGQQLTSAEDGWAFRPWEIRLAGADNTGE